MKKISTYLFVSIVLFYALNAHAVSFDLSSTPTSTQTNDTVVTESIFTRSLSIGSYGRDVMALNKILSLELNTSTNTSATFSANTSAAVKALQEKYAVEVLIPSGLSAGTGSVGPSTLKKLDILASKYAVKLSDFVLPATLPTSAVKNVFAINLAIGSVGDDVTLLKTILNSDTSTALSPINSTNMFDVATAIAVKKFQEKYASEILTPIGLKNGTGMVGSSTRKKLNALLSKEINATSTTSIINNNIVPITQKFTVSGSLKSNSTPSDGDTLKEYCDGTTLVSEKIGFGSVYTTKTTYSSQCNQGNSFSTPNFDYNFNFTPGICKKTTYTVGAWGDCAKSDITNTTNMSMEEMSASLGGGAIQKRTVTAGSVSTTTCPYNDTPPAKIRGCELPTCPDDQTINIIGRFDSFAGCLNATPPAVVYTISNGSNGIGGPTFSTLDKKQCRFVPKYIMQINPFGGLPGIKTDSNMLVIGNILSTKIYCTLWDRVLYDRLLSPDSTVKVFGN